MIDIHTHVVPENFPVRPRATCCEWPNMEHLPAVRGATMTIDERPFRTIDVRAWDIDERLAAMAESGVSVQVLSPMPELLSYWHDLDDALLLIEHVNRAIADMVRRAPARFVGFGAMPLQHVPSAIAALDRIRGDHGLAGVELGATIGGVPLGDPRFLPVLKRMADLDLAAFVHPVRPALTMGSGLPPMLETAVVGYPLDLAACITSFIVNDVMGKVPGLRIAFSHGGGALGTVLPRLQAAWMHNAGARQLLGIDPMQQARAFHYDCNVYDPNLLQALVAMLGADRFCVGSDEPFEIRERNPRAMIDALAITPGERAGLLWGNARTYLSMPTLGRDAERAA